MSIVQGFSNPTIVIFWTRYLFVVGDRTVHEGMFVNILIFYPLNDIHPSLDNQKHLQTLSNVVMGNKITQSWEPLF